MSQQKPSSPKRIHISIEAPENHLMKSKGGIIFESNFIIGSFSAGDTVLVRPSTSTTTRLGSICAHVVYNSPVPHDVKGIVIPDAVFPTSTVGWAIPTGAVAGTPNGTRDQWDWTASNMLPGADHTAAGAVNHLAVWMKATAQSDWTFDGSIRFFGVTGSTEGCGGSGSGSNILMVDAEVFASAKSLAVVLSSGPLQGNYFAKQMKPMTWVTQIGGVDYTLTPCKTGSALVISNPQGVQTTSDSITPRPAIATFAGTLFNSSRVIVTRMD